VRAAIRRYMQTGKIPARVIAERLSEHFGIAISKAAVTYHGKETA